MIREQIEEKLRTAFDPVFLEVVDESYRHNVPAGSESHFKVVLVSDRFTGERFLNRHRMIYGTLTANRTCAGTAYLYPQRVGRIAGYYLRVASLSRRGKHRVAKRICNYLRFSSMLLQNYVKTACGPFCFV